MLSEKLKRRLDPNRPRTEITLRLPNDVIEKMEAIAKDHGWSSYRTLLIAYISEGLRADEAQSRDRASKHPFVSHLDDADMQAVPAALARAAQLARKRRSAMSYDDDFYTWTVDQGRIIRERRFDEIDTENAAEEIESWGAHFKHKLADLVEILQTCLLLCWAGKATEFNMHTRDVVRDQVKDMLKDYPGLKAELPSILTKEWSGAIQYATWQSGLTVADFPQTCPWGISELLLEYWYPERKGDPGKSATTRFAELTAKFQEAFSGMSEKEREDLIDEAVEHVRRNKQPGPT